MTTKALNYGDTVYTKHGRCEVIKIHSGEKNTKGELIIGLFCLSKKEVFDSHQVKSLEEYRLILDMKDRKEADYMEEHLKSMRRSMVYQEE